MDKSFGPDRNYGLPEESFNEFLKSSSSFPDLIMPDDISLFDESPLSIPFNDIFPPKLGTSNIFLDVDATTTVEKQNFQLPQIKSLSDDFKSSNLPRDISEVVIAKKEIS